MPGAILEDPQQSAHRQPTPTHPNMRFSFLPALALASSAAATYVHPPLSCRPRSSADAAPGH
jgi:hypothetical protein